MFCCWPIFSKISATVASRVKGSITCIITLYRVSWDAMLKHTGVRFELLTDIDMIMFIERSICGGLSQFKQVCAANKYMPSYDSSKLSYPYNTNSCRKLSVRLQNHFDLSHCVTNLKEFRNISHKMLQQECF